MKKWNSIVFFVMSFLLVLIPKVTIFAVDGSVVGVRFDDFLYLGLLCYLSFWVGVKRVFETIFNFTPLRWYMIFLLFGFAVSIVLFAFGMLDVVWVFHFGRYVQFFLLMILGVSLSQQFSLEISGLVFFILFLFQAMYAALQRIGLMPYFTTLTSFQHDGVTTFANTGVLMGTFSGHFDFGFFVVLSSLVFIDIIFTSRKNLYGAFRRQITYVSFFALPISLWLLIMSKSRSAYLAFVLVLILFAIRRKLYYLMIFGVMILGVLGSMYLTGRLGNLPTSANVAGFYVTVDKGTIDRLEKWEGTVIDRSFPEIVFGSGWSSFGDAMDGYYIRVFGELGLIGFGVFGMFILSFVKEFYRKKFYHDQKFLLYRRMFLYSFLIILVQSLFIDAFASSKIMALFILFSSLFLSRKSFLLKDKVQ